MSQRIYFPNLDGLRFIAAGVVMVSHIEELRSLFDFTDATHRLWLSLHQVSVSGELAVTLFFVLSGYLITYLLLKERERTGTISVTQFYMRRVLRIMPLYFTIVTLGLFVLPQIAALHYPEWSAELQHNFWMKAGLLYTMLPNVLAVFAFPIPHISHIWSIGVEEQFYFIWPWLIYKFQKTWKVLVAVLIGYLIVAKPMLYLAGNSSTLIPEVDRIAQFLLLTRIDCMAIGGIAAYLVFTHGENKVRAFISQPMRWTILLIHALLLFTIPEFGYWTHELYALAFCALLIVASIAPPRGFSLEHKWLRYLGKISYGIYMWHFVAIRLAIWVVQNSVFESLPAAALTGLLYFFSVGLTILLSALSYRFLETPFLILKKKYTRVASYHP